METVKLSGTRKTIARRLTQLKQTVPHFYLTARCQMDALLRLRGEIHTSLSAQGIKLSVNEMLIKASAAKARDGKLLPEDYQGDTASISSHGMFRIDEMFSVINTPQAYILGIGAGMEQP